MRCACSKLAAVLSSNTYFLKADSRNQGQGHSWSRSEMLRKSSAHSINDVRFLACGRILTTTLKDSIAYKVFACHHNLLGFVERFPPTINGRVMLSPTNSRALIDYVKQPGSVAIGKGAHGEVFVGNFLDGNPWNIPTGRYAVKISDKNGARYHDAEVAILEKFNHPNIMRVFAYGFDEQNSVSVLQLGGKTLRDTIKDMKAPDWHFIVKLTKDVAYLLHLLHSLDDCLCHVYQDFKDDNVLLDEDNNPLLIDFGWVSESFAGEVPVGGNIYYRYELLGNNGAAKRPTSPTQKDDIYALGALLTVLTTNWTMTGENSSIIEKIYVYQKNDMWNVSSVFSQKNRKLPDFNIDVAENILEIIRRCIFSEIHAYEVADELKGLLSQMELLSSTDQTARTSSGGEVGPSRT